MRCFFCRHQSTEVIDTRVLEDAAVIRRRRLCPNCSKRFTTYERVEEMPVLVVKRDGKRERFDQQKLRNGIFKAVGKTAVTADQVESIVNDITQVVVRQEVAEIPSQDIGILVANKLKNIDKVAYIRFASVFRRFVDVDEFNKELKKLL